MVFTSIATSFAESIGAEAIIVGWDKEEAATFPDNSKEFLDAFNELIDIGSPTILELKHRPLIWIRRKSLDWALKLVLQWK